MLDKTESMTWLSNNLFPRASRLRELIPAIDCALLFLIIFGKDFAKTHKREYFTHYFLYFC